jgi:hypothetical protein
MIRLSDFLTTQICMRTLILSGLVCVCLQTPGIVAQEKSRTDKESGFSGQRKRADRERSGQRQDFADGERRGRFSMSSGKRRSEDADFAREAPSPYFPAGEFESQPEDDGFVFVNGEFLPGPYTFRSAGKQTFLNDVPIASELVEFTSAMDMDDEGDGRERFSRRSRSASQKTYAEFLSIRFSQAREIIVAFDGRSPKLLSTAAGGNDLLSVLLYEKHRTALLPNLIIYAESQATASEWSDWINGYRPDDAFLKVAKPIVDDIDATVDETVARHAAIGRLDSYTYPLTIAGMIMSVFPIGHLMSNPPNGGRTPDEVEMSPEVIQIVTRSLMLVVALSLLDLVWTLLASQAGTMRELNPVGGRLIDDPAKLIFFKVTMTGLAAGLMYKLRNYRRAQLASWWACLILTLLTVRWLTFNSMLA